MSDDNVGQQTDIAGSGGAAGTDSTPSVWEARDDAMIKLPGHDKPVSWRDYNTGFKRQYTKASMEAAEAKRQNAEYARRLAAAEAAARGRGGDQLQGDPYDTLASQLEELSYLDGRSAAGLVKAIQQSFRTTQSENAKFKQAFGMIGEYLKQMHGQVGSIASERGSANFDRQIRSVVNALGYDESYDEDAKIYYLAHEGWDPNDPEELKGQLKRYFEQQEARMRNRTKRQAEKLRSQPFVPGQGGNGKTGKPLNAPKRSFNESPSERRARLEGLFESIHGKED